MRLFGFKSPEVCEGFGKFFKINDAVRLESRGIYHPSRVEQIEEKAIWIAEPSSHGVPVRLPEGKPVVLISSYESGMQGFRCRVTDRRAGPPTMLRLVPYEPLGRVQRRGYVRVADALPVHFTVMTTQSRMHGKRVETYTRDISAGGLSIYVKRGQRPMVTDVVNIDLYLPSGALRATGEVVWVGSPKEDTELMEIAVQFTSIPELDRKRIIRRVYTREVELRNAGLL